MPPPPPYKFTRKTGVLETLILDTRKSFNRDFEIQKNFNEFYEKHGIVNPTEVDQYNAALSCSNRFKSRAGSEFEKHIIICIKTCGIYSYSRNVKMCIDDSNRIITVVKKDGCKKAKNAADSSPLVFYEIDLVIPNVNIGDIITDTSHFMLSMKTRPRERYKQDCKLFGFENYYLITLFDKISKLNDKHIVITENTTDFTHLIKDKIFTRLLASPQCAVS